MQIAYNSQRINPFLSTSFLNYFFPLVANLKSRLIQICLFCKQLICILNANIFLCLLNVVDIWRGKISFEYDQI